jgi:hypothetical protein
MCKKSKKENEMEHNLPETLYVAREVEEGEDDDNVWFMTREELEELAEQNEVVIVGVYKLEKVVSVTLEVKQEIIVNEVK